MVTRVGLFVLFFLQGCQQPASGPPWQPPERQDECDGWGDSCTLCCEPGYSCQDGRCVDATQDMDHDGWPAVWDCDDFSPQTYPGAREICDEEDNNCNGQVDEGVRNEEGQCAPPCADADGDGASTCDHEPDCDDDDPEVHPGAEEICDGRDNDCDGESDEGFDQDGDGVGACGATPDCDDTDPLRTPGREEVCDGIDNDCDPAETVDNGTDLCGRLGRCTDGQCLWDFDAVGGGSNHETGHDDGNGGWCSGPGEETNVGLVRAPARGTRDYAPGIYHAQVWMKVDENTTSWSDCGPVARLRVNDLDGDGTGQCPDCWFGGDVAILARLFDRPNTYQAFEVDFSIGPERMDHFIEIVVLRSRCTDVTLCVDHVEVSAQ